MSNVVPLVSIHCITYNHEPYIVQCLEGFVMQKTNFRFEAIVHDDASTDGTATIIREYAEKYPDIIKPIYETENQYSKHDGSLTRIMNAACTGKYIAMCEGDDYWTDPLKLQKQVDILESNPDVGLVHTDYIYIDENSKIIPCPNESLYLNLKDRIREGYIWHYYIFKSGFVLTCTMMFRKQLLVDERYLIDHGLIMTISRQQKTHYLSDVTSCYRINSKGMMRSEPIQVYKNILNATLLQLYFYVNKKRTNAYYYHDFKSLLFVAKGTLVLICKIRDISIKHKYSILLKVIFKNYRNILYMPIALLVLIYERLHKSGK